MSYLYPPLYFCNSPHLFSVCRPVGAWMFLTAVRDSNVFHKPKKKRKKKKKCQNDTVCIMFLFWFGFHPLTVFYPSLLLLQSMLCRQASLFFFPFFDNSWFQGGFSGRCRWFLSTCMTIQLLPVTQRRVYMPASLSWVGLDDTGDTALT